MAKVQFNIPPNPPSVDLRIEFEEDLGVTFVSASVPCDQQRHVISCNLGQLADDRMVLVAIHIKLTGQLFKAFRNTFIIESDQSDPDLSDNKRTLFTRRVKKLKRISSPAFMDPPPPALSLDFPLPMPHTHSQNKPQEWRQ